MANAVKGWKIHQHKTSYLLFEILFHVTAYFCLAVSWESSFSHTISVNHGSTKKSLGKPFFAGCYLLSKNKRRSFVSERYSLQIWTHVKPFFEQHHPFRLVILRLFFSVPSWGSTRYWRSCLCHHHQSPCIGIRLFMRPASPLRPDR